MSETPWCSHIQEVSCCYQKSMRLQPAVRGHICKLHIYIYIYFFFPGATTPIGDCISQPSSGLYPPRLRGFLITQRRATVGRTPLNEWSIRRRDLYLTTHNTHNTQTSKPWVGFETTISAGERPKNYALDCAATGTGCKLHMYCKNYTIM